MKLILGDCIEELNLVDCQNIDVVICDPPYKMTKRGKSCRPNWMPNNMGDNVFDGALPITEDWMTSCYNVMSDNSHIYIFTNTISLEEYLVTARKVGFKLHNIITMIKDTGMPNRWYLKNTELVLFLRKGKARKINDMTSRDYHFVSMPQKRKGDKFHVSQKPIEFIEKLVSNSVIDENSVILDPFMGSGTTGIASKNLGYDFIGIEKDAEYFDIAMNRIIS